MRHILIFMLFLATFNAHAQQPTMECYTQLFAVSTCSGGVSPNDTALTWIPGAPNPSYIVRGCMTAQNNAFTAETDGLWSIGVDRNSEFYNASGYPATQNGPFTKMIGIGYLVLREGADKMNCQVLDPPVKFTAGQDRLIVNFDCVGGMTVQPITQVCWKVDQ